MRASSFLLFATLLIVFTTFTAAWPWPRILPDVDSLIVRRQEDGGDAKDEGTLPPRHTSAVKMSSYSGTVKLTNEGTGPTATPTAPAKTDADPTESADPDFDPDAQSQTIKVSGSMTITTGPKPTGTSKPTGTASGDAEDEENTESGSQIGSNKSSSRRSTSSRTRTSTRKAYDQRYPAGGITIIDPKPTAAVTPLYKIGEEVSIKFSMTSCSAYPTAVNVLATCTQNNALYTISANASFTAGKDKDVVWDTAQYGNTEPMLTSEYMLIIYDADGNLEDIGESGYLAPFGNSRYPGWKFNMYEKRPYADDIGGVKCATCNSGSIERVAKYFTLAMAFAAVVGAHIF